MLLAHRIRLEPTIAQRDYFARACGTARRVWNWALAEWLDAQGEPWLKAMHRDSHAQPFANLKECKPVQVDVPGQQARRRRRHHGVAGVDLGVKTAATLSNGERLVVIEDLHVKGMLANEKLARAIADIGFHAFRRQLAYKAARDGTRLVVADRWYPSSKLCSTPGCGWKNVTLTLKEREWTCPQCGIHHDRDLNAAINLERLATVTAEAPCGKTALPVASPAATPGTASGMGPGAGGKVTPARYEYGQQDGSGRETNCAYHCAPF